MIRTILKSDQNNLTLTLPDELVGKMIEIIAFEIKEDEYSLEQPIPKLKPSQLRGFLSERSAELMHENVNRSRAEWGSATLNNP